MCKRLGDEEKKHTRIISRIYQNAERDDVTYLPISIIILSYVNIPSTVLKHESRKNLKFLSRRAKKK